MSAIHYKAALDTDLPVSHRFVLSVIASMANAQGLAWPGTVYLAEKTGICERQIRRILRDLETAELLLPTLGTVGGRGKTTIYRVNVNPDMGDSVSEPETRTLETPKPGHLEQETRTFGTVNPDICDVAIRNELVLNLNSNVKLEGGGYAAPDPWPVLRDALKSKINPHSFETWIRPLRFYGAKDETLFLQIPVPEFQHLARKYEREFLEVFAETGSPWREIRLVQKAMA